MTVHAIDLLEVRQNFEANFSNNVTDVVNYISSVDLGTVYGVSLGALAGLCAFEAYRRWRKGKGLRMALKQERLRLKEILSEGLTDMILDWEVKGTISHQEGDKLYNDLSKKLDLPDLIPRQRRYKIVKNEIKTRLKSPKHEIKKPNIPGAKPPVVQKKFRSSTGSLLKKFWKAS